MTGPRTSPLTLFSMSAVAAGTTWVALLSWRGFTEQSGRFLGPLLALGVVLAGVGALARWWRAPGPIVVLAQLAATGVVLSMMLTGSPIPLGDAWAELLATFRGAVDTANKFAPPVPAGEPGVYPLLVTGGLGCMLLVDALACTARRVPLAGLPLLTVFSVPVSMLGGGLTWWIFALSAAGFLAMLYLQESEQISRWGRALGEDPETADPAGFGVRTGAVRTTAGAIGGVVTALAIFLPLLIPTLSFQVFDFGRGPGGGGDIRIENPMVDLRRDLRRGDDVPLLQVTTDDRSPAYLRVAVLTRFSGSEWSSGDRDVPSSNRAMGDLPPLVGVNETVTREEFDYRVAATPEFTSRWLPTQSQLIRIEAEGDWRFDESTMDFLASDDELHTAGLEWSFTSVRLALNSDALARAGSHVGLVGEQFTELPSGIDPLVRNLAQQVTTEAPSRFEKAVALQNWFRRSGGFVYDTRVDLGSGADDLVAFLQDDEEGRRGYCEQFAAAMAVMARQLGIPARVAVGFLSPTQIGPNTYEYSAHDMHAWPELFFAGAGWVRFEPTPPTRASGVPGYTTDPVTPDITNGPSATGTELVDQPGRGDESRSPAEQAAEEEAARSAEQRGFPVALVVAAALALVLVVAGVLAPRTIRSRRRDRRLAGGAEDAWLELRDTVVDLGLVWPRDRSPRQTRDVVVGYFGSPPDEFTPEIPRRGPDTNPDAVLAIDRIVHALERARYARVGDGTGDTWRAEVETCIESLFGGATRRTRRRATWVPQSLFVRTRPVRTAPDEDEIDHDVGQPTAYGRVVDHVG